MKFDLQIHKVLLDISINCILNNTNLAITKKKKTLAIPVWIKILNNSNNKPRLIKKHLPNVSWVSFHWEFLVCFSFPWYFSKTSISENLKGTNWFRILKACEAVIDIQWFAPWNAVILISIGDRSSVSSIKVKALSHNCLILLPFMHGEGLFTWNVTGHSNWTESTYSAKQQQCHYLYICREIPRALGTGHLTLNKIHSAFYRLLSQQSCSSFCNKTDLMEFRNSGVSVLHTVDNQRQGQWYA